MPSVMRTRMRAQMTDLWIILTQVGMRVDGLNAAQSKSGSSTLSSATSAQPCFGSTQA